MATQISGNAPRPQVAAAQQRTVAPQSPAAQAAAAAAANIPPFVIETVHDKTRYIKLLIYGPHGAGKTTLAGSTAAVEHMNDILMIDAEAGDLSLLNDDYPEIDTLRVRTYKDVSKAQEYLRLHCQFRDDPSEEAKAKLIALESRVKPGKEITEPKRYKTVIIDSLSEVEQYCMYQLLGITDRTSLEEEVQNPEFAEYKRNHSMIHRLVRAFRDLPMNVIMCCAASFAQDENKRMIWQPSLTGKLSKQVQGAMDLVGFLVTTTGEEGKMIRRMYVQPTARFDAKNRFSLYKEPHFDDPTMSKIIKSVGLSK